MDRAWAPGSISATAPHRQRTGQENHRAPIPRRPRPDMAASIDEPHAPRGIRTAGAGA